MTRTRTYDLNWAQPRRSPAAAGAAPAVSAPRSVFLAQLTERCDEAPIGIGPTSDGGDAAWILIVTVPDDRSCTIAASEDWQSLQHTTTAGTGF